MDLLKFGRLRLLSVISGVLIVAAGLVLYREVPTLLSKTYDSNVTLLSGEYVLREAGFIRITDFPILPGQLPRTRCGASQRR